MKTRVVLSTSSRTSREQNPCLLVSFLSFAVRPEPTLDIDVVEEVGWISREAWRWIWALHSHSEKVTVIWGEPVIRISNPQRFPENLEELDSPGFLEDFRSLLSWANWVRQNISQVIIERRNNHADAKRAVESRKGAIYSDDFDHPYGCELRLS